jgi:hypothetical protein
MNDRQSERVRLRRGRAWPRAGPCQCNRESCAQCGPHHRPGELPAQWHAGRPHRAGHDFGRACIAESARDRLIDFESDVTDVAQSPLWIFL